MNNNLDLVYSMHVNASNEAKKNGETTYVLSNLKVQQITTLSPKTVYNVNNELFKKHLISKDPLSTTKCLIYQVIENEGVPFQLEKRNIENPTPKPTSTPSPKYDGVISQAFEEINKYQVEIDALKKKLDMIQAESDAKSARLTNAEKEYRKLRFENTQLKSQVTPTSTVKSLFPIDSSIPNTNNLPNMEEFYNNLTDEYKKYYNDYKTLGTEMLRIWDETDSSKAKEKFEAIKEDFVTSIYKLREVKCPKFYPFTIYFNFFIKLHEKFYPNFNREQII